MSLSLWAAEPAKEKGTPAVAKRILPPPPMVFRPVLELRHFHTLTCFVFKELNVFASSRLLAAYLNKLPPVARASLVPPLTRASPVL